MKSPDICEEMLQFIDGLNELIVRDFLEIDD